MGLFDSVNNFANTVAQPFGGRQSVVGRGLSDYVTLGAAEATDPQNGLFPGKQGPQAPGVGPVGEDPTYQTITNADGTLKAPYSVTPQKMGDTSAWQKLAQQQNTDQTNTAISSAQTKAQTGAQSAWSQLAQNGGLNSGARERVANLSDRNSMFAGQEARAQGANNSLNIGMQGEQMNRQGDQFNIGNDMNAQTHNTGMAAGDVQGQNNFNLQNWLGKYSANAMQNAYNNNNQNQGAFSRILGNLF